MIGFGAGTCLESVPYHANRRGQKIRQGSGKTRIDAALRAA